MLLAVPISSYGCTWEVWRALEKLELLSAAPRATLTLLSCYPNFPRASITPILKLTIGNGREFEDSVKWNTKIWKFSCREKKVC